MTGVVYNNMKYNKFHMTMLFIFMCVFLARSTHASLRTKLNVNVKFVTTTCDVYAPDSYDLGDLLPGEAIKHNSFNVDIVCSSNNKVKTALTASILQGGIDKSKTKTQLLVNGKENGTLLWLLDKNGNMINLSGDTDSFFCEDITYGNRTCSVTPVTESHPTDTFGLASATIRFHVVYR